MAKAQNNVCIMCSRKTKRVCPALAGMICPACCGSRRGSKIECPSECSHFPFGTAAYDLWLRIQKSWQPKSIQYVISKVGDAGLAATAEDFAPSFFDEEPALITGADLAIMYYLAKNDDDVPPLGEIWKREGWPGLNNDERYMTEFRTRSQPGILEVQKILNNTALECIDRLDPERGKFIVFDRKLASTVGRFANMIVWLTHFPHFTSLACYGVDLPSTLIEMFISEIQERTEEECGSKSDEDVKCYLAKYFVEAYDLVDVLVDELQDQFYKALDADPCTAFYELRVPCEEIKLILGQKHDFELDADCELEPDDPPDAVYYKWLKRGKAKRFSETPGLFPKNNKDGESVEPLGMVGLSNSELWIKTLGQKKFKFMKKLIRKYFTKKLKYVEEEIIPIELFVDEDELLDTQPLAPPSENPEESEEQYLQQYFKNRYKRFLNEPVMMIDNLTPRKAACVPSMRPKLIELIKLHLNQVDSICVEKSIDINIDWIVEELGLDDLR